MSSFKAFRVDWYPHQSFFDFSKLEVTEIAVLMQIINLIYIENAPIENNPAHIGKNCNITKGRCSRTIDKLIEKKQIFIDKEGLINKTRCVNELDAIKKRRRNASENGRKGSEKRWETKQNQYDNNGKSISDNIASTSTLSETNNNTRTYNIEDFITDTTREKFRKDNPAADIHFYICEFNKEINNKKRDTPSYNPAAAFLSWSKKYSKNHPIS